MSTIDAINSLSERELLARIIQAEAGQEGELGMLAVGSVIRNRAASPSFGNTLNEVIMQPGQFSPMNSITGYAGGEQGVDILNIPVSDTAFSVADRVMSGQYEDPTGGALNFVNPDISQPKWMNTMTGKKKIGNHLFGTAGGAPPDSSALGIAINNPPTQTLAYDDVQRERLEQQQEAIDSGELPNLSIPDDKSSMMDMIAGAMALPAKLQQNLPDAQVVQATPTQLTPVAEQPRLPKIDTSGKQQIMPDDMPVRFNPDIAQTFAGFDPAMLDASNLDLAFGVEGAGAAGNGAYSLAMSSLDPKEYGLSENDIPPNLGAAVDTVKAPPSYGPEDQRRFDADAVALKERRREFAADALEILSVGLGQIAAGGGVNLSQVLAMQADRRAAKADIDPLLTAQNEPALMDFLYKYGGPSLVDIARTGGKKGKAIALEAARNAAISTPDEQREREQLRALASRFSDQPEIAQGIIEGNPAIIQAAQQAEVNRLFGTGETAKYTPAQLSNIARQVGTINPNLGELVVAGVPGAAEQAIELLGKTERSTQQSTFIDGMDDKQLINYALPILGAGITDYMDSDGRIDREGVKVAIDTVREAGAEQIAKDRVAAPQLGEVQQRAQATKANLQSVYGDRFDLSGLDTVSTQDELDAVLSNIVDTVPSNIRSAMAGLNDPAIQSAVNTTAAASAGEADPFEIIRNESQKAFVTETTRQRAALDNRQNLRNSAQNTIDMIYNSRDARNIGGPLSPLLSYARGIANQTVGEQVANAIMGEDFDMVVRLVTANSGEFFGDFRAEGSGQLTEKEGEFFRAAMASNTDTAIKMALISQRILRMDQANQAALDARVSWRREKMRAGDLDAIEDQAGLRDHINTELENRGITMLPTVDMDADAQDVIADGLASGQITDQTVIRYMDGDEVRYEFYGDIKDALDLQLRMKEDG